MPCISCRNPSRSSAILRARFPAAAAKSAANYKEHDLKGAKETAVDMLEILKDWTPEKMEYEV